VTDDGRIDRPTASSQPGGWAEGSEAVHDPAVAEVLAAYAAARLEPDAAGTARTRERVLAEARKRLASPVAAGSVVTPPALTVVATAPPSRASLGRRTSRWTLALVAAGIVVVLAAGAVAAGSGPGGPLYGARLWVEELMLPAEASDRAEAQMERLEQRLQETEQASAEGNGPAVKAALEAYRAQVRATIEAAGDDLTREERLALMLEKHRVVLATLAGLVPEQASEALNRILAENTQAIDRLNRGIGQPADPGKPSDTPGNAPSEPPGKPSDPPGKPAEPGKPSDPPGKPAEPGKPSDSPGGKPDTPPGQQP
jgi:hypothetical protein